MKFWMRIFALAACLASLSSTEPAFAETDALAVTFRLPRFGTPVLGPPYAHRSSPGHGADVIDLNGDGRPEIVQPYSNFPPCCGPNRAEAIVILSANATTFAYGSNTSTFVQPVPNLVFPRVSTIGDFNGDAKPDLFIGGHGYDASPFSGERNWLLLSKAGQKHVGQVAATGQPVFTHAAASGDINRDGLIDIYVGAMCCSTAGPYFLLGRSGNTPVATLNRLNETVKERHETYTAAALVNVDNANGVDLVLGAFQAPDSVIYKNNGTGFFTSETPSLILPPGLFGRTNTQVVDILSFDFNTDTRPDLIFSETKNNPFYEGMGLQALRNTGTNFVSETPSRILNGSGLSQTGKWRAKLFAADFFGDGLVDFITHRFCTAGRSDFVAWLNDGSGVFTPQRRSWIDPSDTSEDCGHIFAVDVNRDRRSDIVRLVDFSATQDRAITYINAGPPSTGTATAPTIVRPPAGRTVTAGQAFTLNVSARGARPLRFQWLKNGTAISGATSPIYRDSSASALDAGGYSVRVTNAVGQITSAAAQVTVN